MKTETLSVPIIGIRLVQGKTFGFARLADKGGDAFVSPPLMREVGEKIPPHAIVEIAEKGRRVARFLDEPEVRVVWEWQEIKEKLISGEIGADDPKTLSLVSGGGKSVAERREMQAKIGGAVCWGLVKRSPDDERIIQYALDEKFPSSTPGGFVAAYIRQHDPLYRRVCLFGNALEWLGWAKKKAGARFLQEAYNKAIIARDSVHKSLAEAGYCSSGEEPVVRDGFYEATFLMGQVRNDHSNYVRVRVPIDGTGSKKVTVLRTWRSNDFYAGNAAYGLDTPNTAD